MTARSPGARFEDRVCPGAFLPREWSAGRLESRPENRPPPGHVRQRYPYGVLYEGGYAPGLPIRDELPDRLELIVGQRDGYLRGCHTVVHTMAGLQLPASPSLALVGRTVEAVGADRVAPRHGHRLEASAGLGVLRERVSPLGPPHRPSRTQAERELAPIYILNDNLIQLGMPTGFIQGKADFSGMTLAEKIWISFVIHQAYVKVDEKGTEAAAATAVGMVGYSMPRNTFKADHPFIFIIQDKGNGNILFMGKMANPNLSG